MKQFCVQCKKEFDSENDDENGDDACAFHVASYDSYRRKHSCCGDTVPCKRSKHRSKHHCDYPYAEFFIRSAAILNYTDTRTMWMSLEDTNLDDNSKEICSIGQLLRWKSRGALIKDQNLVVVRIGSSVWHSTQHFFHVFTPVELDDVGKKGTTLIFCSSPKSDAYSKAEWIIEKEMVAGIRMEVKVASNDQPSIGVVRFSPLSLDVASAVVEQRGGIVEKKSSVQHALGDISCNSNDAADLETVSIRKARDDFQTLDAVSKKGHFVMSQCAPFKVNQNNVFNGKDGFLFHLTLTNTGDQASMFLKMEVEYKYLNDKEWISIDDEEMQWGYGGSPLPITVGGLMAAEVAGKVFVPFPDEPDRRPWFYRSYAARHRPIRFRFSFVDAKGNKVSRVFEYVEPMSKLTQKQDRDTLFLAIDDPILCNRNTLVCQAKDSRQELASLGSKSFNIIDAQKAVHQARKSGKSEVALTDWNKEDKGMSFYALVDRAADVVYAVKAIFVHKDSTVAKQGYCPIRFYGQEDAETVEGTPAVEEVQLPKADPTIVSTYTTSLFNDKDDGLDDLTKEDLTFEDEDEGEGGKGNGQGGASVDLSRVEKKLDALNSNMERIANALEALVASKSNGEGKIMNC